MKVYFGHTTILNQMLKFMTTEIPYELKSIRDKHPHIFLAHPEESQIKKLIELFAHRQVKMIPLLSNDYEN